MWLNEEVLIREMTTKLSGIIFRKALMENNWTKVYKTIITGMVNTEIEDEIHLLKIFGDIGG
jgi:hypothetical protein